MARKRRSVPLATSYLFESPAALVLAVAGIGGATTLLLVVLSLRKAVLDRPIVLLRLLDADLVLTGTQRPPFLTGLNRCAAEVLQTVGACDAVASATALRIERGCANWRASADSPAASVCVLAFDPAKRALLLPSDQTFAPLKERGSVLFSRGRDNKFIHVAVGDIGFLSDCQVRVAGEIPLDGDEQCAAIVLTSETTFGDVFGKIDEVDRIDLVLLRISSAGDPRAAVERLRKVLPQGVSVHEKASLLAAERAFWHGRTPLVAVLNLCIALSWFMSMIVLFSYLLQQGTDRRLDFAVLHTIGYRISHLVRLLFVELLLVTLLGALFAAGGCWLISWATSHFFDIEVSHLAIVLLVNSAIYLMISLRIGHRVKKDFLDLE